MSTRGTTTDHPRPPSSRSGSRTPTGMSRINFQSNSSTPPSATSSIFVDKPVTSIPVMANQSIQEERPESRSSTKLNPVYVGPIDLAPSGFVNEYRGKYCICYSFGIHALTLRKSSFATRDQIFRFSVLRGTCP